MRVVHETCIADSLADSWVHRAATHARDGPATTNETCRQRVADQTAVTLMIHSHLTTPMAREQRNRCSCEVRRRTQLMQAGCTTENAKVEAQKQELG